MTVAKKVAARKTAEAVETVKPLPPRPIEVKGRKILTRMPTPEQLMIVEEVFSEIGRQEKHGDYETGKQTIKTFYRVIPGMFTNAADVQWLDDGRYNGEVSIYDPEVLTIPEKIIEAWRDAMPGAPSNRADKRAALRKKT